MKIRLSLTLNFERRSPPVEYAERVEASGSYIENAGAPRYAGFAPETFDRAAG